MAAMTVTEGGARLLSFLFYVMAARALSPGGFGRVRYTLTIVLIAFFLLQVVVKAISRELGAARGDPTQTDALIGSSAVMAAGLLLITAGVCVAAGEAGLLGAVDVPGLVVAVIGYTTFQVYYAIGRGVGETLRPAVSYVGGSLVQIAAFGVIVALGLATPRSALIIYGLSSVVPIVLCELHRPLVLGRLRASRGASRRLMYTAVPLIAGQIGFIVWNSADQIWVQADMGTRAVGLYGAARNLSQLFIVIPTGVGVALLPRVAELRTHGSRDQAVKLTLSWCVAVSVATAVLAMIVILSRGTLLSALYGSAYRAASSSLLLQSIGMVFYAAFATLTGAAVGWGWARVSVVGISVAGATEVILLLVLAGRGSSIATAAGAFAGSIGLSLAVVLVWGWFELKRWSAHPDVRAPSLEASHD
jgi:O-antigen/teichoic acid export membrane protein